MGDGKRKGRVERRKARLGGGEKCDWGVVSFHQKGMLVQKSVVIQGTWTRRKGDIAVRIMISSNTKKWTPACAAAIPLKYLAPCSSTSLIGTLDINRTVECLHFYFRVCDKIGAKKEAVRMLRN